MVYIVIYIPHHYLWRSCQLFCQQGTLLLVHNLLLLHGVEVSTNGENFTTVITLYDERIDYDFQAS